VRTSREHSPIFFVVHYHRLISKELECEPTKNDIPAQKSGSSGSTNVFGWVVAVGLGENTWFSMIAGVHAQYVIEK